MICRHPQLFIVIDPMWAGVGWEHDLEKVIIDYLANRPAVIQTVQTVIGQDAIKALFDNNQVKKNAAFLFTEASSDLVILVNKFSKQYKVPVYTLGFWRRGYSAEYTHNSSWEQHWWKEFDRACFKGLERNIFSDEYFKHIFTKQVAKKGYPYSIIKFPIPASVIKEHLLSIQPVEFKTDMILIDGVHFNPEQHRMLALLMSEMKFDKPISIVFAYENGRPTREQYVKWLMNAKVVINFDVQGKIGDDVYEYYAAKCIPLCNAPEFYENIVPEEWRIEKEWFADIRAFIDAMPILRNKLYDVLMNYDELRPKLDFQEKRLNTLYFNHEIFLEKFY